MDPLARYIDAARLFGRHGAAALDYKARDLFRDAPFDGGDVLEIGAGDGLLSLWLLFHGARAVVSLEPEADGSTTGVRARAAAHRARLGVDEMRWTYLPTPFQDYVPDPHNRRFRLIVSHSSINHLDEDACVRIPTDPAARATYEALLRRMHDLLEPGGTLVVTDVARHNAWDRLGLRSPWAPEIEWHKHQEPETWSALLERAGLHTISSRWPNLFYRLRRVSPLLENRLAARLTASVFALTARRFVVADRAGSSHTAAG